MKESKLLAGVEPMARTDEERASHPEGREIEAQLELEARARAERRAVAAGPATGESSRRTLRQMFAFGESWHDDEAGRWIQAAYSYSVQHELVTPSGNDPAEEYRRVHREIYGVRQKLLSLPDADAADWLEAQSPLTVAVPKQGRSTKGARADYLEAALAAVFTQDERAQVQRAVKAKRHRRPEQQALLQAVGVFATATGANVEALKTALGISRRTIYRLIEEATLYNERFRALEARVGNLEGRADKADRRHFTLEADVRSKLAGLLHGRLEPIRDEDPRSLDDRLSAFLEQLAV